MSIIVKSATGSTELTSTSSTNDVITLPSGTGTLLKADGDGSGLTGIATGADTSLSNLSSAGQEQVCSAWVQMNAASTPIILDSFNVSSITDVASSRVAVNWTVSFATANYAISGHAYDSAANAVIFGNNIADTQTADSVGVTTYTYSGAGADCERLSVMAFGNQ